MGDEYRRQDARCRDGGGRRTECRLNTPSTARRRSQIKRAVTFAVLVALLAIPALTAFAYKFSVDEDSGRSEVDQFLVDLNLLVMAKDKQSWFSMDPQILIDNETDVEFGTVDIEFGAMMTKCGMDLLGHSAYIRSSVGIGSDRPTDGSGEAGYKIVR